MCHRTAAEIAAEVHVNVLDTVSIKKTYGVHAATYYVIRTDGVEATTGKPRCRHWSRVKAENEAQRLARLNPGVEFVVVKKKAAYLATDITATVEEDA